MRILFLPLLALAPGVGFALDPPPAYLHTSAEGDRDAAARACRAVENGIARAAREPADYDLGVVVSFSAVEPWCHGWTYVTVYHRIHGRGSEWAMRRFQGSGDRPDAPPGISWAASAACPGMLQTLQALQQLPIRFDLGLPMRAGSRRGPAAPPMVDGVEYSIRSFGLVRQPSGRFAMLTLSSNEGEPADWVSHTLVTLSSCWKEHLPPAS